MTRVLFVLGFLLALTASGFVFDSQILDFEIWLANNTRDPFLVLFSVGIVVGSIIQNIVAKG